MHDPLFRPLFTVFMSLKYPCKVWTGTDFSDNVTSVTSTLFIGLFTAFCRFAHRLGYFFDKQIFSSDTDICRLNHILPDHVFKQNRFLKITRFHRFIRFFLLLRDLAVLVKRIFHQCFDCRILLIVVVFEELHDTLDDFVCRIIDRYRLVILFFELFRAHCRHFELFGRGVLLVRIFNHQVTHHL